MGRVLVLMKLFARFGSGDREALSNLDEEDTIYQFTLRGEKPFYIVANTKGMVLHEGSNPTPDATFFADKDIFYKIFSGQLSQDDAFLNRKLEVKGAMMASAKFRRVSNMMLASHKTSLKFLRLFARVIPM